MQWVIARSDGVETFHHPCLLHLPQIFLKAIKGIASQVDSFLGKFANYFIIWFYKSFFKKISFLQIAILLVNKLVDYHQIGIYQNSQLDEAPSTENTGTNLAQQQQQQQSRLSGSDVYFSGGVSSISSANGGSSGGGGASSGIGYSSAGGDLPTPPPQHRRLAKSFSVAPSASQKGALLFGSGIHFHLIQFAFFILNIGL